MTSNESTPARVLLPPGDLNPEREPALDFRDREFGTMTPDDYRAIGFLAGLEVHQQLVTRTKLFCRCPSGVYSDAFDAEVLRHMRPTLSELGEYDGTALMEFKTRKEIVYRLNRVNVCTYEIDDTPPFEIDEEAIRVALSICLLFDLKLVSELHVMRKQYLDGSIPTGFQRTAMLGLSGAIPFVEPGLGIDRPLRIRQLSLEEDACREISDIGHRITFTTDRLGMPLTEVVTEPDLFTPWEAQAAGRLIARVTRASGRVRRGPGAARQDVNVSVAGGRRTEIKGVDNHRILPRLTHIEGFRQLNLLRIRAELARRGVDPDRLEIGTGGLAWDVSPLAVDATGQLRRSDYAPLRDAVDQGHRVAAVKLPGFSGLLRRRTQPGVTFAGEIADRVRVIACLTGRPFLIHSDIEGYGLGAGAWRQLRGALRAGGEDAVVAVWGPELDLDTAVREVLIRAREAVTEGVPSETRQAYPDGTNGFERILPGPDRMYPDTDTPPLPIPDAWVEEIRVSLAERPWEREAHYTALGLDLPTARRLADAPWAALYDAVAPATPGSARRLAHGLEKRIPYWRRRGEAQDLSPARLIPLVRALERGALHPEAFEAALDRLLGEGGIQPEAVLREFQPRAGDEAVLERLVAETVTGAACVRGKPRPAALRWAMGQVMPKLMGRVPRATVEARIADSVLAVGEGVR